MVQHLIFLFSVLLLQALPFAVARPALDTDVAVKYCGSDCDLDVDWNDTPHLGYRHDGHEPSRYNDSTNEENKDDENTDKDEEEDEANKEEDDDTNPTKTITIAKTETITVASSTDTVTTTAGESMIVVPGDVATRTERVTDTITDTITDSTTIVPTTIITTPTPSPSTISTSTSTYGKCTNPSITWKYALDARKEWSYITANQADFPHGSTTNIDALTHHICHRLVSPCHAPRETIEGCFAAVVEVGSSGLRGGEAAELWNSIMDDA